MKIFSTLVVLVIMVPNPLFAGDVKSKKNASDIQTEKFSDMTFYPETGDCGGDDLFLVRREGTIKGSFSHYWGDCKASREDLKDVFYNAESGKFSFKVSERLSPDSDEIIWRFKGSLQGDRVSGTLIRIEGVGAKNQVAEQVVFSKVKKGE
jgi:hypothetical protein